MAKSKQIAKEFQRFREIITALSGDIKSWRINYEMYNNKRFISSDSNDEELTRLFEYAVKYNRILPDIHRIANTLKDNKPRISVIPKTSKREDIMKAEYLQNFLTAFFKKYGLFSDNLSEIHFRRLLYGAVGVYSGYIRDGDELSYGIKVLSPHEFFFAPDIKSYDDHKYCYMVTFVENKEGNTSYFSELKFEFYEPDKYDVIIDYFEKGGKHLRFNSSGEVLLSEDNPYGDRLPIVYSYYYYRPRKYLGYGVVDEWRVPQSVLNILLSRIVDGALKSGLVAFAPAGSIDEDIKLGSGRIITYDANITGGNNLPQLHNIEGVSQSMLAVFELVNQLYELITPIFPIETGQLPSYASGSSKQAELNLAMYSRSFSFLSVDEMFVRLANNIIRDISDDVYSYFTTEKTFEFINDEEKREVYEFSRLKITDADIIVSVSDALPVDSESLGTIAFTMMLERAKNPSDYEANKFLEELYRRYGLKYVSNRNRDIERAREENKIIQQILDSDITDTDIKYYLNTLSQGMSVDEMRQIFGDKKIREMDAFLELINKIDPKPYDNHMIHLDVHYDIVKSPEFLKYPAYKRMIIEEMINKHMQMAGGLWSEQGSPINAVTQKIIKSIQQKKVDEATEEQGVEQQPPMM